MIPVLFHALDPASYAFNLYSIPTLVTTAAILLLGLLVLVRERISVVSISFAMLTLAVSIWLFTYSWMYSSVEASTAFWWVRVSYIGLPFIASATYQFTIVVLGIARRYKAIAWAAWLSAAFFSIAGMS